MFATVDYHGSRFFRCYAETEHGKIRIEIPASIKKDSGLVARAIPSKANLEALLNELQQETWFMRKNNKGQWFASTEQEDGFGQTRLSELEIEIWGLKLDAQKKQLVSFPIERFSHKEPARKAREVAS